MTEEDNYGLSMEEKPTDAKRISLYIVMEMAEEGDLQSLIN